VVELVTPQVVQLAHRLPQRPQPQLPPIVIARQLRQVHLPQQQPAQQPQAPQQAQHSLLVNAHILNTVVLMGIVLIRIVFLQILPNNSLLYVVRPQAPLCLQARQAQQQLPLPNPLDVPIVVLGIVTQELVTHGY
jgi:hypothetical protein